MSAGIEGPVAAPRVAPPPTLALTRAAEGVRDAAVRAALLEDALAWLRAAYQDPARGGEARAYLEQTRRIDASLAASLGVGFLPPLVIRGRPVRGRALVAALLEAGHTPRALREAGLAVAKDRDRLDDPDALIDRPKGGGYLAIPLRDLDGSLIAIKYRHIPGLGFPDGLRYTATTGDLAGVMEGARDAAAELRAEAPSGRLPSVLVVEGEIDRWSIAMARQLDPTLPPAVACQGKELPPGRIALLQRLAEHVIFCLDADEGGADGLLRGGRDLLAAGVDVSVLRLPADQDPNAVLTTSGASTLVRLLRDTPRESLADATLALHADLVVDEPLYVARELARSLAPSLQYLTRAGRAPEASTLVARIAAAAVLPTAACAPLVVDTPASAGANV